MRTKIIFAVCALLLASASSLYADDVYTSAAAFNAATSGDTAITFTAPSPTSFTPYLLSYTDATTGTVFGVATGYVDVTGQNYYGTGTYASDFLVGSTGAYSVDNTWTISLTPGTTAFGMDIGGVFGAASLTVTLSDGSVYTLNIPASYQTTFFGVTGSGGISSLTFDTSAFETVAITDATVGNVATPEPASLVLLGAGLFGLLGLSAKKKATA